MSFAHPEYLVSTDWLAAHLDDPAVRVLECTVYLHPDSTVKGGVVDGRDPDEIRVAFRRVKRLELHQ